MFTYLFELDDNTTLKFSIDSKRKGCLEDRENYEDWALLEHKKCKICPLSSEEHRYCPVSCDIQGIVHTFSHRTSVEKIHVRVLHKQREYHKDCDMQTGLNSLLGLVMATSMCPILSKLKPMAYFHLPFSNLDEIVVRSISFYMMKQLILSKEGGEPDWELKGLATLYDDLRVVNMGLLGRLKDAVKEDANLNAITKFFAVSILVPTSIKDLLVQVRPFIFPGD